MALRLEQLAAELVDLHDVDDTLEGSLALATRMAPCDAASVSLRHTGAELETTVASDPVTERAHEVQLDLGEGPCVQAEWEDGVSVVPDATQTQRWPRWAPEAQRLGLSSLLAVRLSTGEQARGVLDLYSYQHRDDDTGDVLAARIIAARVSVAVARAAHERTRWRAIDSRNQIGQAQGILMGRCDLSADAVFTVLRRYSQEQHRKLRAIAQELVDIRRLPRDGA